MSTDFVVSDTRGNVMHCVVNSNIAHRFIVVLQEGCGYTLKNFTVKANREEYRTMKNSPCLIQLQASTTVHKTAESVEGFVRHPFQLSPFEELTLPKTNILLLGCDSVFVDSGVFKIGDPRHVLLFNSHTLHQPKDACRDELRVE